MLTSVSFVVSKINTDAKKMYNVHPDHAMKAYGMKRGEAPLYSEPWRQMTVGDGYHAPAALQPTKNCGTH